MRLFEIGWGHGLIFTVLLHWKPKLWTTSKVGGQNLHCLVRSSCVKLKMQIDTSAAIHFIAVWMSLPIGWVQMDTLASWRKKKWSQNFVQTSIHLMSLFLIVDGPFSSSSYALHQISCSPSLLWCIKETYSDGGSPSNCFLFVHWVQN